MAQVLPFNGFYTGNSEKNSARTCVNYMPIRHDSGALSEYTLESTTGITESVDRNFWRLDKPFAWSTDTGEERAFMTVGVVGAQGTETAIISTDGLTILSEQAIFLTNFPPKWAISSAGSTVASIVVQATNSQQTIISMPSSLLNPQTGAMTAGVFIGDVAYIGDRFLYMANTDSDTDKQKRVYYSDILDPLTVDPLGFFSDLKQVTESSGIHVINDRLYLFSKDGYSVWNNTPDVNLPFTIQKGSSGAVGLLSQSAKTEVGGVLYFIGLVDGKPSLYSMSGGGHNYLGNEYIDFILRNRTSASLFSFRDADRLFICVETTDESYCYDISSGEWHKRESKNSQGQSVKWRVFGSETIASKDIMFGSIPSDLPTIIPDDLMIGISDSSIGTEFNIQQDREVITSPFNSDGVTNNVRELAFQADIDYSSLAPVTLPDLSLSVSENFGKTFEAERLESFDAVGENTKILRYMNIGFFRQAFVFKLKTSTIYPHKILKMLTRLEKGFRQI